MTSTASKIVDSEELISSAPGRDSAPIWTPAPAPDSTPTSGTVAGVSDKF